LFLRPSLADSEPAATALAGVSRKDTKGAYFIEERELVGFFQVVNSFSEG